MVATVILVSNIYPSDNCRCSGWRFWIFGNKNSTKYIKLTQLIWNWLLLRLRSHCDRWTTDVWRDWWMNEENLIRIISMFALNHFSYHYMCIRWNYRIIEIHLNLGRLQFERKIGLWKYCLGIHCEACINSNISTCVKVSIYTPYTFRVRCWLGKSNSLCRNIYC